MRQILLCLTVLLTLTGFSQDSSGTTLSKWTIGLSGSLVSLDNIQAPTGFTHKYSYSKTSFRGGLDLVYHISKRSAITTGLHLFNVSYKADYVWIIQQPLDPHIPRTTDISAGYLDIPLIYDFSILSGEKIVLYTATGIVASILASESGSTTYEDNTIRNFESLNSFITSLQLGAGLQYNVNEKLGIKIEPQYRLFMKGFDSLMDQSPTAMCGTMAIVYKINCRNLLKQDSWRPLPH